MRGHDRQKHDSIPESALVIERLVAPDHADFRPLLIALNSVIEFSFLNSNLMASAGQLPISSPGGINLSQEKPEC
jgi:hypothetical protein